MDIKVDQVQQLNNVEYKPQVAEHTEDFKFILASKIEDSALAEKLATLVEDITNEGKKIAKHMDVRDMKRYRALIREFMNEAVSRTHEFKRENFLDRRGRHRVYGMIKLIDENLDELTAELLKEEKDHLLILGKIDEIRGMLLDILT